jgi:toxin ParE1/3/4
VRRREVIFAPEARDDLLRLYEWIADASSPIIALSYVERVEGWCGNLDLAAERGHRRDDIRSGLRIIGFERRLTIAFEVSKDRVTVLRVFHGGQNW